VKVPVFSRHRLRKRGPALPLFVPWRQKWVAGLAVCLLAGLLYGTANRLAPEGAALPLTDLDRAIPLLPWTAWIYVSGILFLPAAYLLNRCVVSLNRHLWSFLVLQSVSVAIFLIHPTTYPREAFPLQEGAWLLELVRGIDRPVCSAPSLHVSVATLVALGFLEDRREWFVPMAFWSLALSLSTLTTKQHAVVDVVSGFGLACLVFWTFHRWLPARLTKGASVSSANPTG